MGNGVTYEIERVSMRDPSGELITFWDVYAVSPTGRRSKQDVPFRTEEAAQEWIAKMLKRG